MQIQMKIKGLMIDPVTQMPIIILRDPKTDQVLPIWVGIFEANAIALELEKIATPRPMTHDLLKDVVAEFGGTVERVVINDLRENTFYAVIHIDTADGHHEIDSRPSDAIALALRTRSPIYSEEDVIVRAQEVDFSKSPSDSARLKRLLETLDESELGKYEM